MKGTGGEGDLGLNMVWEWQKLIILEYYYNNRPNSLFFYINSDLSATPSATICHHKASTKRI